jgi:hypothetical protein
MAPGGRSQQTTTRKHSRWNTRDTITGSERNSQTRDDCDWQAPSQGELHIVRTILWRLCNDGIRTELPKLESTATGRGLLQGGLHIASNRNETISRATETKRQRVLRNRPTPGAATGACDSASHRGSRTRQEACTPTATTTATSSTFALALTRHEGHQYGGLCWGCRCGPTDWSLGPHSDRADQRRRRQRRCRPQPSGLAHSSPTS